MKRLKVMMMMQLFRIMKDSSVMETESEISDSEKKKFKTTFHQPLNLLSRSGRFQFGERVCDST